MADKQQVVVVKGGGAASVFWGLFLFFIVLPFVSVLGCFACTGAVLTGAAKSAADARRLAEERAAASPPVVASANAEPVAAYESAPETTEPEPAANSSEDVATVESASTLTDVPEETSEAKPVEQLPPAEPVNHNLRTWRTSNGKFDVEAEFVSMTGGKVKLRKTDGKIITVPLDKLSPNDQEFIQSKKR